MDEHYCNECDRKREFVCSVPKGDIIYHFYQCKQCGSCSHHTTYKYDPTTCPKHHWEHIGIEFRDYHDHHVIEQVDRCDRCGAIRRTPRHTSEAGLSGRVEVEDPRVVQNLLLNKTSWERFVPKHLQDISVGEIGEYAELPAEA